MALKGHGATVRYVTLPERSARLRRPRVGAAHRGGDAELVERVREERKAADGNDHAAATDSGKGRHEDTKTRSRSANDLVLRVFVALF